MSLPITGACYFYFVGSVSVHVARRERIRVVTDSLCCEETVVGSKEEMIEVRSVGERVLSLGGLSP